MGFEWIAFCRFDKKKKRNASTRIEYFLPLWRTFVIETQFFQALQGVILQTLTYKQTDKRGAPS